MPIDPLPSISRSDANFRTQVDDYFLTRLPAFSTQAESARVQIVEAQSTATSAASTASTAATTATTAADTATSARDSAVTAKNAAETAAAQAVSGNVATPIHAATDKPAPADADELGITDSAASWGLKKLTFANIKTWLSGLYVGKTGAQSMTGVLTAGGFLSDAGALGYGVGAGGTVTQETSKSTVVVINKPSGIITMHAEALAAGASVAFGVTNSLANGRIPYVVGEYGAVDPTNYKIEALFVGTNFAIKVTNISGVSRSEALVISFVLLARASA